MFYICRDSLELINLIVFKLLTNHSSSSHSDLLDTLTKGHGAYLMEKTTSVRGHNYQNITHLQHRPGVRIVTAVQPQQHHHITIGQGHILDRQHLHETIDLQKLAEDAADLFGDHDDLALDPSLSELALQVLSGARFFTHT